MKPKYLLFSAALLAMTQAVALTPVKKQISKVAARNKVAAASVASAPIDKDAPAYRIVARIPLAKSLFILLRQTRACIWLISPTMIAGWM